ncbi:MAG: FixH family protein [Alteraurantiacibacter sp.]
MTQRFTGTRRFTGWHMFAVMVAFFGVVIAVNLTMMRLAMGSFGGVVVENSYVASQEFNGWLDAAKTQDQLGWSVTSMVQPDRSVAILVTAAPEPLAISATARHPLGRLPDLALTFRRVAPGRFVSTRPLPEGRWTLRLQLVAGRIVWRDEVAVQ